MVDVQINQLSAGVAGVSVPEAFFQVFRNVYRDMPQQIPEQPESISEQLSSGNLYFENSDAEVFFAEGSSRLVGFFNPELKVDGETIAFFGFWESVNDTVVSQAVFHQFENWAKKQGCTRVFGPVNFSTYGANRIRIDSFDKPAMIGEPCNPEYYPQLLEDAGYSIRYRYMTSLSENVEVLCRKIEKPLAKGIEQANAAGFRIERLTPEIWMQNLDELYPLVDLIFRQNFAYSPISEEAFRSVCGQPFADKLDPEISVLVRDAKDRIAGFFLIYPDYSELVNQGSSDPVNEKDISYKEHFPLLKTPRIAVAKTGGIHPDYRTAGLFTLMGIQAVEWSEGRYDRIYGAMVREDNPSLRMNSTVNGEVERTYALFEKALR